MSRIQNGTYILQGTVDPDHLLTESNRNNDVVDTELHISGDAVTVLKQWRPVVRPPLIRIVAPARGSRIKGAITLRARASAVRPAKIAAVQYLLDGLPLGRPVRSAPYRMSWVVGSTLPGRHLLSARVTDSAGVVGTAPVEEITVISGSTSGLGVDRAVVATGRGAVKTPRFSTSAGKETLLALIGSDGPATAGGQAITVTGAGL